MWIKSDDNGHCERIIGGEDKISKEEEKPNNTENIIKDAINNIMEDYNTEVQMTDFAKDLISKYGSIDELSKKITELADIYLENKEYGLISTYIYFVGSRLTGRNLFKVKSLLLNNQKRDLQLARIVLNEVSDGHNKAMIPRCNYIKLHPMSIIYYCRQDIKEYKFIDVARDNLSLSIFKIKKYIISNTSG